MADPVASYAAEGLQGGAAVLLITTEAHGAAIKAALAAQSIDLAAAALSGQLQILGARPLLAGIMLGGLPDEQLFRELVGAPLERARGRFGRLRVYGEMVDLLWAEGNRRAALRMEELWNDLLRERGIPLLCASQLGAFL